MAGEWKDSIYSDSGPMFVSNPLPRKSDVIHISLRMLKNNEVKHVFLRYKEFGSEKIIEMDKGRMLKDLVYYGADVQCNDTRFQYQFYIVTDTEVYYYTQYRLTDHMPDESRDFVIPVNYSSPVWVDNTVFYQIFPDRFFNARDEISVKSDEYVYQGIGATKVEIWDSIPVSYERGRCMDFYGGDLYGIIEKLDYLQDLNVTALYLNPIFYAPTTHRYDCLDYFKVDPHLGGEEALILLSDALHKRGMKLVLDISVNHTSVSSKWFNKDNCFYDSTTGAYQNPDSPERKFYSIDPYGNYEKWHGVETMPQLNYRSECSCAIK